MAHKPHAYIRKIDDGIIIADTTTMLSRWEQFYSNLLNANQSTSYEGSEIYTAEPEIPKPFLLEVELTREFKKL